MILLTYEITEVYCAYLRSSHHLKVRYFFSIIHNVHGSLRSLTIALSHTVDKWQDLILFEKMFLSIFHSDGVARNQIIYSIFVLKSEVLISFSLLCFHKYL